MPPAAPSLFGDIGNRDMTVLLVVFFTFVALAAFRRLPEPWVVKHYVSAVNDRGGNIIVLAILSSWFFMVSVRIFYYAFQLLSEKKLDPDNAILLMGVQFVSNSAFGMCFGALLKTMTGSDSMARGTDSGFKSPGRSSTATVTTGGDGGGGGTTATVSTSGDASVTATAKEPDAK